MASHASAATRRGRHAQQIDQSTGDGPRGDGKGFNGSVPQGRHQVAQHDGGRGETDGYREKTKQRVRNPLEERNLFGFDDHGLVVRPSRDSSSRMGGRLADDIQE